MMLAKQPFGFRKQTENLKLLKKKYDPDGVDMLRMESKVSGFRCPPTFICL